MNKIVVIGSGPSLKGLELSDLADIATVVLSQPPTSEWHASIGDATLADAILDRLMHNAHRIVLKGESMRKKAGVELQ